MSDFETGAATHGANDLALTLLNDGSRYEARKRIGFAMLQGDDQGPTFRNLCSDVARESRAKYGSRYSAADISEAASIVQDQTIEHCCELIRDEWNGRTIVCAAKRWFDRANSNSYFTCGIAIPHATGHHHVAVPFQSGYEAHWEHVCVDTLRSMGLFADRPNALVSELPVYFVDAGYGRKRDMHKGGVCLTNPQRRTAIS